MIVQGLPIKLVISIDSCQILEKLNQKTDKKTLPKNLPKNNWVILSIDKKVFIHEIFSLVVILILILKIKLLLLIIFIKKI